MPCPNCSAATEDGALECAACGVVFEKWSRRAQASQASPAAPEEPERTIDVAKLIPLIAGLAVLGVFGALALTPPSGQTAPSGAITLSGGFALKVPDGWQAVPIDCERVPQPCAAATITQAADPAAAQTEASGGIPLLVAATLFSGGPRLPGAAASVDAAYLASWMGQVDRFTLAARAAALVDGLPAVRVSGSGPKHLHEEVRKPLVMKEEEAVKELRKRNPGKSVITYQARLTGKAGDFVPEVVVDPGEYRDADHDVALAALLVGGRRHTLLLSCSAEAAQKADCDHALSELEKGLRVVDRPRRLDLWTSAPIQAR